MGATKTFDEPWSASEKTRRPRSHREAPTGSGFDEGGSFRRGALATLSNTAEPALSLAVLRLPDKPFGLEGHYLRYHSRIVCWTC
jgi:hypothetical protein